MHFRIHREHQPDDTGRDTAPDDESGQHDHLRFRRDRRVASVRRIQNTGVAFRHGLRQRILFPLIQQIEIKLFLNLLLAFHRKHILLLRRYRGNTPLQLILLGLHILDADPEAGYQVIHRTDNGLLHRTQRIIQIHHHRVLIATVPDQVIPLQQHLVIGRNLLLYRHIRNRIGRNQVERFLRVRQVVPDILRDRELILQAQALLPELTGIL